MSDHAGSDETKFERSPFVPPLALEFIRAQMEVVLREHADLVEETQRTMAAWTQRRFEEMEAVIRTYQRLCNCKEPGEVASACSELYVGSMRSVMGDISDAFGQAVRLASRGQRVTAAMSDGAVESRASAHKTEAVGRRAR